MSDVEHSQKTSNRLSDNITHTLYPSFVNNQPFRMTAADRTTSDGCYIMAQPAQEFHLFPNLPIELRLQIWEKAMLPRMIRADDLSGDRGPALLRTCRDSRAVTRPKYQDYRATRIRDSVKVGFFVNPSIDIFEVCQFDDEHHNRWQIVALLNIISCRYPPWLNNAERLAISLSSDNHGGYPNGFLEQSWRQLNKQFPNLKELIIIMDSDRDVKLHELLAIQEGSDKLGKIKERFCASLKKNQEEKGLLKSLELSFVKGNNVGVEGKSVRDPLDMEKAASSYRHVAYNGVVRSISHNG